MLAREVERMVVVEGDGCNIYIYIYLTVVGFLVLVQALCRTARRWRAAVLSRQPMELAGWLKSTGRGTRGLADLEPASQDIYT